MERVKQKCFQLTAEGVGRLQLFHARGAATEKARSPIRRRVRGTTKLPRVEARNARRVGTSATGVSRSEMYCGVCPRRDLWHSKHNLYWILCAIE